MRLRQMALAAWLILCAACGAARSEPTGRSPVSADERAIVRIINQSWSDVRVHVARGGARSYLGFVTAGGTDVYPVPADFVAGSADLELVAEPVGSTEIFLSDPFLIDPGRVATWTIMNDPAHSTLTIR